MKIAFATEDGKTISRHFGRAPYYVVLTIENGQVVGREQREKASHGPGEHHHDGEHIHGPEGGQGHGHGPAESALHNRMAAAITDCAVMIVGGMGTPAYEGVLQAGVQPIITELTTIDEAAQQYIEGRLVNRKERLH